jgi:murein DD-endopeptidase MepM/ murein hydrolase activator NlpD
MPDNDRIRPRAARSGRLVLEFSLGSRTRRVTLSTGAVVALGLFALVATVLAPCAAAFLAFRDDMLADLGDRQAQMRYAYEDRLAALRLKLDQATSRQFADQDDVEGKLRTLVLRQAKLETRAAVVARLVENVASGETLGASAPVHSRAPSAMAAASPPAGVSAYAPAPVERPAAFAGRAKPEPGGMELRLGHEDESRGASAVAPKRHADEAALAPTDAGEPLQERLDRLSISMDRIERDQTTKVARLVEPMRAAARRLRGAFDAAGLPAERFVHKGASAPFVGGPFVPADRRSSDLLFERELCDAQEAAATLEGLRKALPNAPLRKPLAGEIDPTSGFGYRTDPFFGRAALHTGIDLRDDYGAPVRATAAGIVVFAGANGGYGQMVEVDHGSGVVTRYAHLSAIAANVGQQVEPGAVLGRLGSTGRSTGPHLHYEVRIDGEPVDPARFLRAGAALAEMR